MGKVRRKHIIFSGRVQGVGFRYTACYLARPLGLTGWVQGDALSIEEFLGQLENGRFIRIHHMDIEERPVEEERGFCERW